MKFLFSILYLFLSVEIAFAQPDPAKNFRQWTDKSGDHSVHARLINLKKKVVELEKENGEALQIAIERLSDKDVKLLDDYSQELYFRVISRTKRSIYAYEVRNVYKEFQEQTYVSEETDKSIDEKLYKLESSPHSDAVVMPDGSLLSESEIPVKREEASQLIDRWIKSKDVLDHSLLKKAGELDPFGIEAELILALYFEINKADNEVAERHLKECVLRGERYLPLANDVDQYNYVAAHNNLGVAYAKANQVAKAIKTFERVSTLPKVKIPKELSHNVAKIQRMSKGNFGMAVSRSEGKALNGLALTIAAAGGNGGWQLMCPQNAKAIIRDDLGNLVKSNFASDEGNGTFVVTRCMKCEGSESLQCPIKPCKNGLVEKRNVVAVPFNINGVQGFRNQVVREQVKCDTCEGDGHIHCPFCEKGHQR